MLITENTNEEVSAPTDPDATCEAVAAAKRCAFISICIYDVWDAIGRAHNVSGSPLEAS